PTSECALPPARAIRPELGPAPPRDSLLARPSTGANTSAIPFRATATRAIRPAEFDTHPASRECASGCPGGESRGLPAVVGASSPAVPGTWRPAICSWKRRAPVVAPATVCKAWPVLWQGQRLFVGTNSFHQGNQ